jgi:hypothetical protein
MRTYQLGSYFTASLNIRPTLSFEAAVAVIGEALGISFTEDQSGKYEEYPAYLAFVLGLEVALLAPPLPEFDIREEPDDCYQLIINHKTYVEDQGVDVDLTALIEAQLRACTKLELKRVV